MDRFPFIPSIITVCLLPRRMLIVRTYAGEEVPIWRKRDHRVRPQSEPFRIMLTSDQ